MELPKRYDAKEAEKKWQQHWEKKKIYAFDPNNKAEIYSVDTPPPTVSGSMHIGHAFSYTQTDFIVRYQRMTGKNIFYPFGTDDNGLATERLIESTHKVRSKKMDRDEFVKLCLDTLKKIRPEFIQDWKNIGISCDFSIFYSTIDDHSRRISQKSFLDLYKDGRIERKKSPIIFCPHCKTAIAQVEMEDKEKKTTLNYIKAKIETGEFIIFATTRPELSPACVGISLDEKGEYATIKRDSGEHWVISKDAVEKMQEEFPMEIVKTYKGKELVGKKVDIPLATKPVTISHDISAQTQYGTGIVYYCTYGGLDCVEWMARHQKVKPIHIMDESGTYIEPSKYKGLTSDEARKAVLKDLEEMHVLLKKEEMKHTTNVHERCGTPIEYIATEQWFIRYLDLKKEFLSAGKKLHWFPKHMRVRYDNWVNGLQWDWCISRQRHFGVPIPVWYDEKGSVILPEEAQLPVDPLKDTPKGYKKEGLTPEKDVLDTWATSSLTPQLAVDLFKDHPVYKKLFPMTMRPQAHDIITFWLFNTVVKSQLHYKKNPWRDCVISGFALDPHARKMSKSKGNVVHPQDVVEKYGADALRFWAAGSKLGEDLPYQEKDVITGQKFITKLWNSAKFVFMNLEDYKKEKQPQLTVIDKWILSRLSRVITAATNSFEKYEYFRTKADTELFFWQLFCDNYLEIVKDRIYNPDARGEDSKKAAQYTLYEVLLSVLKLMAPITPHITEELYHLFYKKEEKAPSVHLTKWPTSYLTDKKAEALGDILVQAIASARRAKTEKNLSLKAPIKKMVVSADCAEKDFKLIKADLVATANIEQLEFKKEKEFAVKIQF